MNTSDEPQDSGTSPRRRSTSIAVAAGLLAGGAIGLVASVPSLTSAASDDDGAVVVTQQEDTDEPTDAPTAAPDDRPAPGERWREALQPLVDDGTIDATQADAVAAHLAENRPEHEGHPGRLGRPGPDGHGRNDTVVADLLGIDPEALRSELRAGNSIAEIAEANGIDVQTVIDGLIAEVESHVDEAIEHGLDEERAAERLERLSEQIEERVYRTPGGRPADG